MPPVPTKRKAHAETTCHIIAALELSPVYNPSLYAHRTPPSSTAVRALLKMYNLVFTFNSTAGNTTETTYEDVLNNIDQGVWPDGWETTMSHESYVRFREPEAGRLGYLLLNFAALIFL